MSEVEQEAADGGRGLRVGTLVLAAVALTLLFMVLRFPYDRLADRIAREVEAGSGARVQLGHVSLGLVRWAPGLTADAVRVQMPSGTRIDFDRVGVRPALALSWLRFDPALATEVEAALGRARGVITLGTAGGFRGRLESLSLGELPEEWMSGPLVIEGLADVDVDLVQGGEGSEGEVHFQAREGVLQHPELPLPVPYETIDGEIALGGARMAVIERLELVSPLVRGRITGTLGRAASFEQAPLDLDIEITVSDAIRGSLTAQGVQVGQDGRIRLKVLGTPAKPIVR